MLNKIFNNPNTKKMITLACLVIIVALFGVYQYVDDYYTDEYNKNNIVEGVINSNCCGGVQSGVHYQETDTRPPEYIRRCFRSNRDNGELVYEWSGFPCTSTDSKDCCQNKDGIVLGDCVPTSGGGYCNLNDKKKIFRRGEETATNYIKRSDDKIIDINNTIDMEDYFYERDKNISGGALSPDMKAFLERRDENSKYIQSHILERNRDRIKKETEAKLKANEEHKIIQIKSTILAIHLIFVLGFALLIKDLIIERIDSYYGFILQRYLEFLGKSN